MIIDANGSNDIEILDDSSMNYQFNNNDDDDNDDFNIDGRK